MNSLQGKILLASSRLMESNFVHTVILMVQHDENGALGLVLNRPLELTIREACDKTLEIPCLAEGYLHQGGPVDGPLMVLHEDEDAGEIQAFRDRDVSTERSRNETRRTQ